MKSRILKKKVSSLEKRVAELERQVQEQQLEIEKSKPLIREIADYNKGILPEVS